MVADKYDDEIEKVLEPYIYEIVCESPQSPSISTRLYPAGHEGSISAEHGLGKTLCESSTNIQA